MRELVRSFVLGSVVRVDDNGGTEGEEPIATGRSRWLQAVVVSGPVAVPEGARSQPDRSAPELGPNAVQSHRRQPPFPRDGRFFCFFCFYFTYFLSFFNLRYFCYCMFGL